ncbi:hypothetical protein U0026_20060 [Kluyvera intermedia]|uniref:hypothetical protein n=1 Tax=Kluyvera intermedia TaxID=61648 RepID=UPI000ACEAD6B|nr:hypothetical protein [Kluyvera intermedia]WQD29264.1 hypothetical protein U0026_20060 [Kluyvera intermedia]VDZ85060.1 Uncharacterised protein [Kluyvera intermedia]
MQYSKLTVFFILLILSPPSFSGAPNVTSVEWASETSLRVTVVNNNYIRNYYHVLHSLFSIISPNQMNNNYPDSSGAIAVTPMKYLVGHYNKHHMLNMPYVGGSRMTAKLALEQMGTKMPGVYIIDVPSNLLELSPNGYCIIAGFAFGSDPSSGMWIADDYTDPCKSGGAIVPPPPAWCAPVNNVSIDFGTVNPSDTETLEKSALLNIYCAGAARYMLKLSNNSGSVSLSNGGVAKIKIAGVAPGSILSSTAAGTTSKTITATLEGVKEGAFRGTSVLRVEML